MDNAEAGAIGGESAAEGKGIGGSKGGVRARKAAAPSLTTWWARRPPSQPLFFFDVRLSGISVG